MADFAPNYTVRYKLHYSVLGHNHTALVRATRGSGAAGAFGARDRLIACITALAAARFTNWTVLSGEYSLEDSNFFSPDPAPGAPAAGVVAVPANPLSQGTVSLGFVGRSVGGQKARLFIYGTDFSPESATTSADNFRILASENGAILNAIAALNGGTGLAASDNNIVSWYNYVNVKYNDFWVRRIRA